MLLSTTNLVYSQLPGEYLLHDWYMLQVSPLSNNNGCNGVQPIVFTASGLDVCSDCSNQQIARTSQREETDRFNRYWWLINEIGHFVQISKI
jgi:hypothetical protein